MIRQLAKPALLALAVVVASCSDSGLIGPASINAPSFAVAAADMPPVRISEIHYDNTGTDTLESIEISGPAGASLAGWSIVLYSQSSSGTVGVYNTRQITATIPATCEPRGVLVFAYPVNGIQNGGSGSTATNEPDAIALVNASGGVVEFLSYEGVMKPSTGPASGLTSTDIGVRQAGGDARGLTLQRDSLNVWRGPKAGTLGTCNDNDGVVGSAVVDKVTVSPATATIEQGAMQQFSATATDANGAGIAGASLTWMSANTAIATVNAAGLVSGVAIGETSITATASNGVTGTAAIRVTAPPPPADLPTVRFSEIHYDNGGTDVNEAIEIEGPAGTVLTGWSVVLYNETDRKLYNTTQLSGTIAARCDGRGVVVIRPTGGIQNGPQDGFALVNASGEIIEFLSYEGVLTAADGPAAGKTSKDIGVSEPSDSPAGSSLQRDEYGVWSGPKPATMGGCNNGVGGVPTPPGSVTFSGRQPSDPALPVGFQDQIFANFLTSTGAPMTTTVTWTSESPEIASIDADGVITALAPGTAILRATATDGTTGTWSLPTRVATQSTTAQYGHNTEFGEPMDGNANDDFIIRRAQYTSSFNSARGIPNWVSYNLDATHFGSEDRCDCFTFDPELRAAGFTPYTTADYTGAGTFHGYGIDRGHMVRSFDREAGSLDNATTFYFSNIIPQAADLNQGPWSVMETYLGDLARFQNKEVFIITGPVGTQGTVKNEGLITIPDSVWKVALIMPRDRGLGDIDETSDFEVIAVMAPNDKGVRGVDWTTWKTTVDAIEASTGYDLLALLDDQIEIAAESNTKAPVAAVNGPYTGSEGSPVTMSAASSTDADGDVLTYRWEFGDRATADGVAASHTYAQNGEYTVRMIVTDPRGLVDTAITTASIANVAPTIAPFAGAVIWPRQSYMTSGSFTDPGADSFTGTVDYGDGTKKSTLAISGRRFTLAHQYTRPGSYTVTVTVSDGESITTETAKVTVLTPAQVVAVASEQVENLLANGTIAAKIGKPMLGALGVALQGIQQGNPNQLDAALRNLQGQLDRMTPAESAPVRPLIEQVIISIAR